MSMERYLEIIRRTGLPVIVAQEKEEPIVLMPLDAYEAFLGITATQAPVSTQQSISTDAHLEVPAVHSEIKQKTEENIQKQPDLAHSAEDRFFLESIE